jgi:hypothetical protein
LHDAHSRGEVTQRHYDQRNAQVEALEPTAERDRGERRRQCQHDAHEQQRGWLDHVEQRAVDDARGRRQGRERASGAD